MNENKPENIESVQNQDDAIFKNSILYLHQLTNSTQLNVTTLKSLYRTKCRLMELRNHVVMQNAKRVSRCERCFLEMSDTAKVEIHPVKTTRFAQKILAKVKDKKLLTSCQRQYYRKLSKKKLLDMKNKQKLVKFCRFCGKKSETIISKVKHVTEKPEVKVPKQYFSSWLNAVDKQSKINIPTKSIRKQKNNKSKTVKCKKVQHTNKIKSESVSGTEVNTPFIVSIKKGNMSTKIEKENENDSETVTTASVADRNFLNTNHQSKSYNKNIKKAKFQLSKTANAVKDVPKIINITKKQKKQDKKKMENMNKMLQNAGNKNNKKSKLQSFLDNIEI
ncbi:uncharacterized protein LOC143202765 [Rhynchophorus ferrugineus]|uniref:uncharacterized protein LOC143202765 n=1 Tax=Rhynchophorus ferrugineus TaxID=354439 RepID=UPI003FCE390C